MMGIFSKWVESLDYEYEILNTCTRHKSPRSTCRRCADSCPSKAISIIGGIPVIDGSKCNQCGKCIAACPVQAVAGIFPKRSVTQNQLIVTNKDVPAGKELLIYYKRGIRTIVCETEQLNEEWQEAIDEANGILQQLEETQFEVVFRKVNRAEEKYTRRELFFSWKQESQSLLREMAPAKWRFNQDDLDVSKYYPNHQFAEITLNHEKCVLCKACQALCNKKCFSITEEGFSINPHRCTSCRMCQDICPENALTVIEKVMVNTPVSFPAYTKVCSSCNKSFQTLSESNEECVACVKRKGYTVAL